MQKFDNLYRKVMLEEYEQEETPAKEQPKKKGKKLPPFMKKGEKPSQESSGEKKKVPPFMKKKEASSDSEKPSKEGGKKAPPFVKKGEKKDEKKGEKPSFKKGEQKGEPKDGKKLPPFMKKKGEQNESEESDSESQDASKGERPSFKKKGSPDGSSEKSFGSKEVGTTRNSTGVKSRNQSIGKSNFQGGSYSEGELW